MHMPLPETHSPLASHKAVALVGKAANLLLFNALWLGFVLGRYAWLPLCGAVLSVYLVYLFAQKKLPWPKVFLPAAIGIFIDSLFGLSGLFVFPVSPSQWWSSAFFPLPAWFVLLWVAFATTLTQSLGFLAGRLLITVPAGAIAFPLNYWVGSQLGAVSFPLGELFTLLAIGLTWAICLPLLFASLGSTPDKRS